MAPQMLFPSTAGLKGQVTVQSCRMDVAATPGRTQPDTGSLSRSRCRRAAPCCNLGCQTRSSAFSARVTARVQPGQGSRHCRVPCRVGNTESPARPWLTHETHESLKAIYRGCHIFGFFFFQKAKHWSFFLVFSLCRLLWLDSVKYCQVIVGLLGRKSELVMTNEKFNIV